MDFPTIDQQPEIETIICVECFAIRKAFPLMRTSALFVASFIEGGVLRRMVDICRLQYKLALKPAFPVPSRVQSTTKVGVVGAGSSS